MSSSSLSIAGPAALRPFTLAVRGSGLHVVAVGVCGRGAPVWSGTMDMAVEKARPTVLLASMDNESLPEEMGVFSTRLDDMRGLYARTLRAVGDGTADEFAQDKLQNLAERSVRLLRQVADNLKPPMDSGLYKGLWETGVKFTGVAESARAKLAPWGFATALSNDLDGLLAMVSSATNKPLPGLIRETGAEEMEMGSAELALLATVESRYAAVAAAIKAMLG